MNQLLASRLVVGISFVLSIALVPAHSATPPKAGSDCTKQGITKTYKGKIYKCKKLKGKIVWNKGKVAKQAAPVASQTALPSPSPSPSSTPSASSTPTPTPTPSTIPTPKATEPPAPITFDNLDLKWTSIIARRSLLKEYEGLTPPSTKAHFRIGPNVRSDLLVEEKRLLKVAERMFSGYFLPEYYEVLMFSEKDGIWADEEKESLVGPSNWSISKDIESNPNGCNFAGATITTQKIPMYSMCLDSRGRGVEDKQTTIHEYFHLVQQKYSIDKMTCWLVEGSATYFGIALGVDGSDPSGESSLRFINALANQYNPNGAGTKGSSAELRAKISTDNGAINVLRDLELRPFEIRAPGSCLNLAAYTVGSIATEALIAVKGFKAYMNFISTFPTTVDWKIEFRRNFDISPDEFYLKLAPYLRGRLNS